jgi:mannose-6-phosphate isomerase-like protein (cupin superfamily)
MKTTAQKRVIRANENGWDGVPAEGYRPGAAVGVARHTIVGSRKSDAGEPGPSKELRYFELQPGAVSRLEKHEHEHFVIVKRGIGYAVIDDTLTEIGPNDVVYVGPLELHQFVNRGGEPFGFYCFVDAVRDFSQEPAQADLDRLAASPAGAVARPFAVPPPQKRS